MSLKTRALYFYDTEFCEDGRSIDLLSIGIVSAEGREFYAVSSECDLTRANDWVKENVLPKIDFASAVPRAGIRRGLEAFVRADPRKPEFWAYYADYDHVALCQLFGRMIDLPKGWPMYTLDLKQLARSVGDPELPKAGQAEHNALEDARWNRSVYDFLEARRRSHGDLLTEWLRTPFFERREDWERWVSDFRPRVERALSAR